jgi:Zn-dependent membrane protease YugP
VRSVLNAAARTYVAALVSVVAHLIGLSLWQRRRKRG